MATKQPEGSPRERLLAAANELFYQEGVHTVGIDRVLERAGVAKASLYSTFGSKDELVRAYLQARADRRRQRVSERLAKHDAPREQILAIFDLMREITAEPAFRGCAFLNASAEGPQRETGPRKACLDAREWMRALFADLARGAGAPDPERLGRQLMLLYDGVMAGSAMERAPETAREGRATAELLLDAAVPSSGRRSSRPAPARRA